MNRMRIQLTLFAGCFGMILAASDQRENWQYMRGNPAQTGYVSEKLPEKLSVIWSFQAGDSFESGVAIDRGIVFAGSMDENFYALDAATGKVKWKQKIAPFKASPAIHDQHVYIGDLDGKFHCFDCTTGKKKWSFETGAEAGGANFFANTVLFTSHDEHLYSLELNGKERWKFRTEGPIYGSPTVQNGKTFLVGCDSKLHVIDISTGKEISSVDLEGQTAATAAVHENFLYIGTMKNEVKAIDWLKSDVLWTFRPGRNAQAFYSSAAVTEDRVVIGSRDNRLYCLDRAKGTQLWSFLTGNKVDSSPVIIGDKVVVGSLDGNLHLLKMKDGTELQRLKLDGPINASPAYYKGKIYVGTQKGTLYCLGG